MSYHLSTGPSATHHWNSKVRLGSERTCHCSHSPLGRLPVDYARWILPANRHGDEVRRRDSAAIARAFGLLDLN